ncbi:MAG: DUF2062 domain-containing protein [Nitrospirae bacterium]|nr:DUF2062 domain-containing protein [Nitrospirota bacterium]
MSIRDRLKIIFSVRETPRKIALAFAMGVFIGISPFLGLHTLMAIAFASVFRLNKLVTLAGAFVTNPWTIIPIYSFATWIGIKMTGHESTLTQTNFKEITIVNIFSILKELILPFFVGTICFGLVAGAVSYLFVYSIMKRMRKASV